MWVFFCVILSITIYYLLFSDISWKWINMWNITNDLFNTSELQNILTFHVIGMKQSPCQVKTTTKGPSFLCGCINVTLITKVECLKISLKTRAQGPLFRNTSSGVLRAKPCSASNKRKLFRSLYSARITTVIPI